MKILWLASWYPNKLSPLDGDFVQRHARAVSMFTPLTVIYVAQYGEQLEVPEDHVQINNSPNLTEIVVQFRFKKTGFAIVDKIRYNLQYYSTYKKLVKQQFKANGLPDLVHVHVPMKAGTIAKWIKWKWRIPFMVSEQASTYMMAASDSYYKRNVYYRTTVASIFSNAVFITNVSAKISNQLKTLFNVREVHTIHNTVNINTFYYRQHSGNDVFTFIHVSAMSHQKNMVGMLQSFHQLKQRRSDWRLLLVGPAGNDVAAMVQKLELENFVTFTGVVTYTRVAELMRESDSFVLFSRHENFPCVIVEALCCGLPVIASNIAGIPEAVDKANGLLVEVENKNELTKALETMLDNDHIYDRKKIADDAKKKYCYGTIGRQFFELYKQLPKIITKQENT